MEYNNDVPIEKNAATDIYHVLKTVTEVARYLWQEIESSLKNEPTYVSVGNNAKPFIHENGNQDTMSVTEAEKRAEMFASVGNALFDAAESCDLDVAKAARTTVNYFVSGGPSLSKTDMVVTRSRRDGIRGQKEVNESSHKREQGTQTSHEVEMEAHQPYPRGYPQTYGGTTYGSPLSFGSSPTEDEQLRL